MNKTKKMLEIEGRFGEPLEDLLRRMYVEEGLTTIKIGEQCGASPSTIGEWLRECEIPIRTLSEARLPKGFTKPSKEELERLYVEKGFSTIKIAEQYRVSNSTIGNLLREYKIPIRTISEAMLPKGIIKPSKEELKRLYVEKGFSTIKIAEQYGVTSSTIGYWLRECEIPIRTLSEAGLPKGVAKPSKEELERLYVEEGFSKTKIAEQYRVSNSTIGNLLREYKIPIRNGRNTDNPEQLERLLEGYIQDE